MAYIAFRSTELEGIATGIILDLLIDRSERGRQAAYQLVAEAIRQFKEEGLALAAAIMLGHTDEYQALRDQEHIPCPRSLEPHPLTMCCWRSSDQVARADLLPERRWFYTLGDYGIDALSA